MAATRQMTVEDTRTQAQATTLELWAAGELDDDKDAGGGALAAMVGIVGTLIALSAFFLVFAPAV